MGREGNIIVPIWKNARYGTAILYFAATPVFRNGLVGWGLNVIILERRWLVTRPDHHIVHRICCHDWGRFCSFHLTTRQKGMDGGYHPSYLRGEQKKSEWDWRPTDGDSLITDWTDSADRKFRLQIHMAVRHPFVVGGCLRSSCEADFKRQSVEIHSCYKQTWGQTNVGAFRKPTVNRVNGEVEALKAVAIKIKLFVDMAV